MNRKLGIITVLGLLWLTGCSNNNDKSDAYGNFEATTTTVASQGNGQILSLNLEEGDVLPANKVVGVVDTVNLHLQKQQLIANRKALKAQIQGTDAQAAVFREQIAVAQTDLNRIQRMIKDSAATQKQLDDASGKISVLHKQIASTNTQKGVIESQIAALTSQIAGVNEKIQQSKIVNPIDGTVLVKYAEPGEVATYGKPLYDIANLKNIDLRVYVSGAQLPKVKLGEKVKVIVDKNASENRTLSGKVIWVSSDAEFTPKNIQTKEERVAQVYAVKVRVPNDGTLKIGMPGEVVFE